MTKLLQITLAAAAALLLAGCNSQTSTNGEFSIATAGSTFSVVEGNAAGVNIPVIITRAATHTAPLTISAVSTDPFVITNFTSNVIAGSGTSTTANVTIAIADLPIQAQNKTLQIVASDGAKQSTTNVTISVTPTSAPDIYLLVGQSNMVGFSGDGSKQAGPGQPDEPNPRIKQLNVSKNDQDNIFLTEADFSNTDKNIVINNAVGGYIVQAEDPLHEPLDPAIASGKSADYIGMGLSFAKAALPNTTADIVLVPAAWSGSSFCNNNGGPIGNWNTTNTGNANLGNTYLFNRALTRASTAIALTDGVLRGILWHQGEGDSNNECASTYAANIKQLAEQLRSQIGPDARGSSARDPNANIPFVLGTMSKGGVVGDDESNFSASKLIVDAAHRNIASQVSHSAFVNNDDLVPPAHACGNGCIHFGPTALREMGARYYQALVNATNN